MSLPFIKYFGIWPSLNILSSEYLAFLLFLLSSLYFCNIQHYFHQVRLIYLLLLWLVLYLLPVKIKYWVIVNIITSITSPELLCEIYLNHLILISSKYYLIFSGYSYHYFWLFLIFHNWFCYFVELLSVVCSS